MGRMQGKASVVTGGARGIGEGIVRRINVETAKMIADPQFKAKYGARVPMARMAEPRDLKGPLVFLASAASSYVTGHELRVEGGFTAW